MSRLGKQIYHLLTYTKVLTKSLINIAILAETFMSLISLICLETHLLNEIGYRTHYIFLSFPITFYFLYLIKKKGGWEGEGKGEGVNIEQEKRKYALYGFQSTEEGKTNSCFLSGKMY